MSEHGISGIRLLLLLRNLRNVNALEEDSPSSTVKSTNVSLRGCPMLLRLEIIFLAFCLMW